MLVLNPIALRKAKIVCNFGLSECNRVKTKYPQLESAVPLRYRFLPHETIAGIGVIILNLQLVDSIRKIAIIG